MGDGPPFENKPEVLNESTTPEAEPRKRRPRRKKRSPEKPSKIPWMFALPLSIWCGLWLLVNTYDYVRLTWHIFVVMKWWSFVLPFNPSFLIWILGFSSSVWAPLNLLLLPWGDFDRVFTRKKGMAIVLFVPMIAYFLLGYVGPYFYPITYGKNGAYLRFIPIIGGKGFESSFTYKPTAPEASETI
jgi:hypothetical protein